MSPPLANRLLAVRQERFVGRKAEQNLFASALTAAQLPFNVLFVHGPGGIGKTSLLRAFMRTCESHGVTGISLDARNLEPTPDSFLTALGDALELALTPLTLELLRADMGRWVILLDTYEVLDPLDTWLRESFLPELPEQALMVVAGRNPPTPPWRVDPGWQSLVRVVGLQNLSSEEARRYLASQQIPEDASRAALEFTHGHPLALSLVVDVLRQQPRVTFEPRQAPDVIGVLLEQFVHDIPGSVHRAAIEGSALVRVTTQALLAEVLDASDVHDVFEWLRDLSFMEAGPLGLFPHDLAREALTADLRWRDPDRFAELHRRAREYYRRRLTRTRGREQQRVLSDYIYLHRDNPALRPFLDWQETGSGVPDAATPEDHPGLLAMVRMYEGEDAADLAAFWLERRPSDVLVVRGADREPLGFLMILPLAELRKEDKERDPALRAASAYLRGPVALRPGELGTYFRFWMARDSYQSISATQSLIFLKMAQHYLTTPNLAFTFFPVADASFWAPGCAYIDLFPIPEASFQVGGHRYHVYGHDWRAMPPLAWLDLLAGRELDHSAPPPSTSPENRTESGLSEAEFIEAVRAALRGFTRPRELRDNPLLRSKLLLTRSAPDALEAERVPQLQALLRRAADTLQQDPRRAKYRDALHHAYFHPAPSQEQAARLLYVSFSTFRRNLKAGVDHVVGTLWDWERIGREPDDTPEAVE